MSGFLALSLSPLLLIAGILSAGQFASEVSKSGPKAAVAQLAAGGDWGRVIGAIRGGAGDWIALAPELARGVDDAQAAQLTAALAAALPRAPSEVLAVTDLRRSPVLGVQAICGVPAGSHAATARGAYLADAREAVELLPDVASVGRAKAVCLKELALAAAG
jgi:hypothetical protein